MANGFISSNEILDAEDVGDSVWNELYWRSFFQNIEKDEFGKVASFKMHDLVHDLARFVAEEVRCTTKRNGVTIWYERIDHLSYYWWLSSEGSNSIQLHQAKYLNLRTYIIQSWRDTRQSWPQVYTFLLSPLVLKCYSLRVLHCEHMGNLSSSIGDLKHLRYLNLSGGKFKTLPESLCKLWNLQILKLDRCNSLQKLPNSLIRLKALQQLSLDNCLMLSSLPPHLGKLTSLRSLTTYFVGKEGGFLLAELGPLNLKGNLDIKRLGKVKSIGDAKEANLSSKQLNGLWLSWYNNEESELSRGRNEDSELQENVEEILEVLQPDTQHLQSLSVVGYKGAHFPQWMSSSSLKYLNCLELNHCESCLELPVLEKLPSLKRLGIYKMAHVKYVSKECYEGGVIFMALEYLSLGKLPNLIRLSREDGENMFPRLSTLEISECPKLLRLSREDGENMFLHLSRFVISRCPELLGLPSLPSINDLHIEGECKQDLLSSIHKLSSLESLGFKNNRELTRFPDGMLQNITSLKRLHLDALSKLEVFPTEITNLNSIQDLYIGYCYSLKSLADEVWLQGLHPLKKLDIRGGYVSPGFQYLTCLEDLSIGVRAEVRGLHEGLQHLTALKSLELRKLPDLESLPDCFGNLPLLRELIIQKCPNLTRLPTSLSLSNLEVLNIYDCVELGKRCEKETGEDWPKIAHIPFIDVYYDSDS